MLQRDLRRGRIEQKCAPKPPPVRPHKPLQTNGGTDEVCWGMLQRDLRRGRIEQKCAPKPPPVRPHKPLQTNGGTDELANPSAAALHLGITLAAKPRNLRCLRAFNSRFSQASSPRLPPRLRVSASKQHLRLR